MLRARPGLLESKLLPGVVLVSLGGTFMSCKPHPHETAPAPEAPTVVPLAPGIAVTVVPTVDPDEPGAEFLCSTCYQTFPLRTVHVVPTWNDSLHRYVGSNRCDRDWKPSLAETRARITAGLPEDELFTFLEVFTLRGWTPDDLLPYTSGKSAKAAALALLDAVEKGTLKLSLDGRR